MTKTKNRRYFDVNVFVYYLTADKTYGERAKECSALLSAGMHPSLPRSY